MAAAVGDNDLSKADPESANPQGETARPRKRRRRTVACTQCRSRKLKCDREYPSCGRCLKGRVPESCTYEDSFVWQQPNTVAAGTATSTSSGGGIDHFNGNHITLPPPTRVAASPGFGAASLLPAYPKSAAPLQPSPQSLSSARFHNITTPDLREPASSRARFLDTVLDAPNPPVNSEWPRIPGPNASQRGHPNYASSYEHPLASPSQRLQIPNKVLIRGKETRTRFNGGGIVSNLMLQFPELGPFLHEVKTKNPNFNRVRMAKNALKLGGMKHKLKQPFVIPTTATLLSLLPPKPVIDTLLRLYILYVESMYRVIHIPSFRRELSDLHAHYGNPDMISAAFVVQLLLILASAVGFYDAEPNLEYINIKSSQVIDWITHAEKWFDASYIKRPDMTVLRIHCLLLIAKNSQGLQRSHAWLASGNLVKLAMLSGYHRDPASIPKISIFSREMRRRLWQTIIELDAQIAIDRGMPPTLQASDYDTLPPLNINDDEIHDNTTEEPQSRPVQEVTDCTFTTVLTHSLSLRLKICRLMNSPVISCSYEDVLRLEWELGRFQASIPAWPPTADREISDKLTLWNAVLETKLGQALLSLHTPFAIEANEDPLFEPSSRSRLEAATVILSRHLTLHETSPRLSFGHPADPVCQAALSVLQHLFAKRSGYTSNLLRQVLPVITESLLELVEKTIASLESRLLLIIKGAKQFFFLYMIFALVKAELHPDQAEEIKGVILDRICTVTYRILRGVDEMSNPDSVDLLPSFSQVPRLAPGNENDNNTPLSSVSDSLDGSNLSDLMLAPTDDFNSLLQVLDWEDFASFPIAV